MDPELLPQLKPTPPIMSAGSLRNIKGGSIVSRPYRCFESARRFEHVNKALLQCLALGKYLDFLDAVGITNIQTHLEGPSSYLLSELTAIGAEIAGPDDQKYRSPHSNVLKLIHRSDYPFLLTNTSISRSIVVMSVYHLVLIVLRVTSTSLWRSTVKVFISDCYRQSILVPEKFN